MVGKSQLDLSFWQDSLGGMKMAKFIITGNYSVDGMRGLMANPSDREAAVKPLIAAAGGKILSYLITFGETDFHMVVEGDDPEGLMAALIVAGASGGVSNLKTQQAFTTAEFLSAQKRAKGMASGFKAPNS